MSDSLVSICASRAVTSPASKRRFANFPQFRTYVAELGFEMDLVLDPAHV